MQRHRDDTSEKAATFFATGCSEFGLARALRGPPEERWLVGGNFWCSGPSSVLPATAWPESMRAGWEAIAHASEVLVAEILSGEIHLEGTSPSGLRRALVPAELAWPHLALDFQFGEMVECFRGSSAVLWKDVTVTEAAEELPATRTDSFRNRNSERRAKAHARKARWQAAADLVWKRHPDWLITPVARQVETDLKEKRGTWDIIRKKITPPK